MDFRFGTDPERLGADEILRFRLADWTYAAGTTEPEAAGPGPRPEPGRWPVGLRGSDFPLEPRRAACASVGDDVRVGCAVVGLGWALEADLGLCFVPGLWLFFTIVVTA